MTTHSEPGPAADDAAGVTTLRFAGCQVVGVDNGPGSGHALRWAATQTDRLGPVQPVLAWQAPWWAAVPYSMGQLRPPTAEQLQAAAERMVADAVEAGAVGGTQPPVAVSGAPGPTLVAVSEGASLLVVGTRLRGSVTSGLLGSVSSHCVHHATSPVAVVPPDAPLPETWRRVVVGVDGSEHGLAALHWAAANTPADCTIEAVNTWHNDTVAPEVAVALSTRLRAESGELLDQAIGGVADAIGDARSRITPVSLGGDARHHLRAQAEGADVLVVGARGRGRLAHLVLGSVATSLVHHPPTTTVVVR